MRQCFVFLRLRYYLYGTRITSVITGARGVAEGLLQVTTLTLRSEADEIRAHLTTILLTTRVEQVS